VYYYAWLIAKFYHSFSSMARLQFDTDFEGAMANMERMIGSDDL
jgi:hypothetical protein